MPTPAELALLREELDRLRAESQALRERLDELTPLRPSRSESSDAPV